MTSGTDIPTDAPTPKGRPAHRLLVEMSPERFAAVYDALSEEVRAALDGAIATMLNSRVAVARRRPVPMKLKALRAFLARQRDDDLSMEMLRGYLLGPRADLVKGFLDATGVPHEDGQITDEGDDEAEPDPQKVPGAIEALLAAHDREDVLLYLEIASRQWPAHEAIARAVTELRGD